MFTGEYIRTFRASTEKPCMSSAFLIEFRVVYYRVAALLRRCSTIDFFTQKKKLSLFFFKQLVFDTFPEKNILYSNVAVWKLQAYNFTERNSTIEVSLRIFQTFAINFFFNISICGEEVNYMKDYIKARR